MATTLALSALVGVLIGFPLLQWGLRFGPDSLATFERRCGMLFLPLLAGSLVLLFALYRPGYASLLAAMLFLVSGVAALGGWNGVCHTAAALLIAGIFVTEGVLAAAARQAPVLPPGWCVEIAGRRVVPAFVTALTTHYPVTPADMRVAREMWHAGDRRVLPVLLVALQEPDAQVGYEAIDALVGIGRPAVPALIDQLLTGVVYPTTIDRITEILRGIGDPKTVSTLIDRLREKQPEADDPSSRSNPRSHGEILRRVRAVGALGRIGDRRALPVLDAVFHNPKEEPEVRAAVAWTLGDLAGAGAIPLLVAALSDDADHVRNAAAERLAAMGGPAEPALRDVLRASLARPGRDLGEGDWAAWALMRLRDRESVPLLEAADRKAHYTRGGCVFCQALGRLGRR